MAIGSSKDQQSQENILLLAGNVRATSGSAFTCTKGKPSLQYHGVTGGGVSHSPECPMPPMLMRSKMAKCPSFDRNNDALDFNHLPWTTCKPSQPGGYCIIWDYDDPHSVRPQYATVYQDVSGALWVAFPNWISGPTKLADEIGVKYWARLPTEMINVSTIQPDLNVEHGIFPDGTIQHIKGTVFQVTDGHKLLFNMCSDDGLWSMDNLMRLGSHLTSVQRSYEYWLANPGHQNEPPFCMGEISILSPSPQHSTLRVANALVLEKDEDCKSGYSLNLQAFRHALTKVWNYTYHKKHIFTVHIPPIQAWALGVEKRKVERVILETLVHRDVKVFLYENE